MMPRVASLAVLSALLALAGCGTAYRPGTDGTRPTLTQNQSSNAEPQPAGSLNR